LFYSWAREVKMRSGMVAKKWVKKVDGGEEGRVGIVPRFQLKRLF
jgi:hypothetical protein